MTRPTKMTEDDARAAERLHKIVDTAVADLALLCKKHQLNRRRCGLNNFSGPWEIIRAVNLLKTAEKYPGCIEEFKYYLNQDRPLPDAGSFIAILWAAVESYKQEGE